VEDEVVTGAEGGEGTDVVEGKDGTTAQDEGAGEAVGVEAGGAEISDVEEGEEVGVVVGGELGEKERNGSAHHLSRRPIHGKQRDN
jgi:hypothetical protein